MSRVEGWLYSSGMAGLQSSTQELTIDEGGGAQTVLLPAPAVFSDALVDLQTAANNIAAFANTYGFAWDLTTQTVVIGATNPVPVNFTLAFVGNLHNALGFASSAGYAGATQYTGDRARALGRFDRSGGVRVEGQALEEGPTVRMVHQRYGRHRAIAWGNHNLVRLRVWLHEDVRDDYLSSYCHGGRVRYYPTDLTTEYSATNPGGYIDGYVVGVAQVEDMGAGGEEWTRHELTIARAR